MRYEAVEARVGRQVLSSTDERRPPAWARGVRPTRGALRRLALVGAVLLALVPAALLAQGTVPATGTAGGAASGGLGLTRADWEGLVGPGETGQGAEWYRVNGLLLNVLFYPGINGRVYSIDWHAPTKAGIPLDQATMPLTDAQSETARLLPTDAVLRENFYAPANGTHPLLLVQLYHSDALQGLFGGQFSNSGDFVACYLLSTALMPNGGDVLEVNLFVGTRPPFLNGRGG